MIDCDLWGLCERQILELAMTSYNKPKRYFEKSGVVWPEDPLLCPPGKRDQYGQSGYQDHGPGAVQFVGLGLPEERAAGMFLGDFIPSPPGMATSPFRPGRSWRIWAVRRGRTSFGSCRVSALPAPRPFRSYCETWSSRPGSSRGCRLWQALHRSDAPRRRICMLHARICGPGWEDSRVQVSVSPLWKRDQIYSWLLVI